MRILLITLLVIGASTCFAQEVSRESMTSGGDYHYTGDMFLSWSYGQVVTDTYSASNEVITTGFQQPDYYCFGDFDNNGTINTSDLLTLLPTIGCTVNCATDLTFNGSVNTSDLLAFLVVFGTDCSI